MPKTKTKSKSSAGLVKAGKLKFDKTLVAVIAVVVVAAGGYLFYKGSHAAGVPCVKQTVRSGSTGHCVSDAQYMLNYFNGSFGPDTAPQLKVDGIYGPATAFTVGAFEKWDGIKVDGVTSPLVWQRLCANLAFKSLLKSPDISARQSALASIDAGCYMMP